MAAQVDHPVQKGVVGRARTRLRAVVGSLRRSRAVAAVAVVLVLVATGVVSVDTWTTNRAIAAIAAAEAPADNSNDEDSSTAEHRQAAEGTDVRRPASNALASWTVPADEPRAIYIDKLGVSARVLPMGRNADNSLQAPINIYDAGWYTSSAKPGQPGATLIDGHSGLSVPGIFSRLGDLEPGDHIRVETGGRATRNYEVVKRDVVDRDDVNMSELMIPHGADRGLNLVSCTGAWDSRAGTASQRVLIFAKEIST